MHFQTSAVSQMDHFGFIMFILRAVKLLRCRSPFSPFPQPRELHPSGIPWGIPAGMGMKGPDPLLELFLELRSEPAALPLPCLPWFIHLSFSFLSLLLFYSRF